MIEAIILNYLADTLSTPVFMEEPEELCGEFVLIEKVGSSENDRIQSATVAVQSYAQTLYKTATLNEAVKRAMQEIIALDCISRCKLNSDYNFTDTQTKRYRYQAVFDLTYYDS